MTTLTGIAVGVLLIAIIGILYCKIVELPRIRRKEAERRRADLLLYLFKNRHIDILKMPTEDIIATAKKLDDYISGKE